MNSQQLRPIDVVLARLEKVQKTGAERWIARCPAHADHSPSLSISDAGNRVLLHCFAGCDSTDVVAAIGLQMRDLFLDRLSPKAAIEFKKRAAASEYNDEQLIIELAASDTSQGKQLSPADAQRVYEALERTRQYEDAIPPIDPAGLSEDALALVFERRFASSLRYCHTSGNWFEWTGTRWQKECTQQAFAWAREICRDFGMGQPKFSKAATVAAVERLAQSARCFAVTSDAWDRAPWLLGTPYGTVDLLTGQLRASLQSELMTRQTAIAPAEKGSTPEKWLAFLHDTTRGDAELIRFLQQMAGYALTGDTSEHALFFIYGAGGNGKSVFLNTLSGILGEYAMTAAMDTFTASHNDKHPTDLAMLKSARLVTASETEDGRAWAEAKIKQMTGGDPITARFMRRDFFTYRPEFKLVIVGNHKPRLNNVDDATRRRLNIIPFIHKPTSPSPDLERTLRDEWPAILRWAIDGCVDWQKNGLVRPAVVIDATREYFEDQDIFGQWLAECCAHAPRYRDPNSSLFPSWKRYAEAAGEHAGSAKAFGEAMRKRGFEPYKSGSVRGFVGLRLKPLVAAGDSRFVGEWDE